MNAKVAKKLRKELRGKIGQQLKAEKFRVAKEFRDFVNGLSFINRVKLCREIIRGKL